MADILRCLDMRWPDIRFCTEAIRLLNELLRQPNDPVARRMAAIWAEANHPEIGMGITIPGIGPAWNDEADHFVYIAWVLVQIILGNTAEILSVIQPMLEVALEHQLNHRIIELSLLEAQAYYAEGQKEHAWKPLRSALSLGEIWLSPFNEREPGSGKPAQGSAEKRDRRRLTFVFCWK